MYKIDILLDFLIVMSIILYLCEKYKNVAIIKKIEKNQISYEFDVEDLKL